MQPTQPTQFTQPTQAKQATQPTFPSPPTIPVDVTTPAEPATARESATADEPATAALPTTPADPATAALPTTPADSATAALPTTAAERLTATLPATAVERSGSGTDGTLARLTGVASSALRFLGGRSPRSTRWRSTSPSSSSSAGNIGYPWTEEMVAVARKHENVDIDTSAYTARRYPPGLVRSGSNDPMPLPQQALAGVDDLGLDEETREAFLHGNAERLLAG